MKSVLSTIKINKKLENSFRENNIELTQHDFIETEIKEFDIPRKYKNWIFTSKNAVNAVFSSKYKINYKNYNYYCVGENTKYLLINRLNLESKIRKFLFSYIYIKLKSCAKETF